MSTAPAFNPPNALPRGTRLHTYEIKRVLGVGGFGIVYLAVDLSLEREVAIKEYMPASLAGRAASLAVSVRSQSEAESFAAGLRSFVNEARLLARFDDPSLVKVHHYWQANNTAYMVMPYYNGGNLKQMRLALGQAPEEAWLQSLLLALLGALERLHREDIFHRDISPDNIIIEPDGRPVLLDFGAARRVLGDSSMTLTAILKPSYAPIEQYAETGAVKQGPWTDLYALGATIHYLLLGRPPAPATTRTVQDDQPTLAEQVQDNPALAACSARFLATVDWMLQPRPHDRPRSVEQARDALLGRRDPPPARPADWRREPVWEPTRIEPGRAAVIAPTVLDLDQIKPAPPQRPSAAPQEPTVWMSRLASRTVVLPAGDGASAAPQNNPPDTPPGTPRQSPPVATTARSGFDPHSPEPWIPTMAIPRKTAAAAPAAALPGDAAAVPAEAPAPELAAADDDAMRADTDTPRRSPATAAPRRSPPDAEAPARRRPTLALIGAGGALLLAGIGLWLLLRGGSVAPTPSPSPAAVATSPAHAPAPAAISSAAEAARATAASLLGPPTSDLANGAAQSPAPAAQSPAPAAQSPAPAAQSPAPQPAATAATTVQPPPAARQAKAQAHPAVPAAAPGRKAAAAKPAAPVEEFAPSPAAMPARAGLVPGASMVATPAPAPAPASAPAPAPAPAPAANSGATATVSTPAAAVQPPPAAAPTRPSPGAAEPEMVLRSRSLGPAERCEGRSGAAYRSCLEAQCRNAPELREHPDCQRLRREGGASEPR